MTDKAIRAALLTAKRKDTPAENVADYVADLLRQGRASEITNDLLEQADPQRLHQHYTSGATGQHMPMDYDSRMARAKEMNMRVPAYRGTLSDEKVARSHQFVSQNPDVAQTYAGHIAFADDVGLPLELAQVEGGNIMPLAVNPSGNSSIVHGYEMKLPGRDIRSQFARFDPRLSHLSHLSASTGGAMEFARHHEAVQRAGGQIDPSKYLPDVPRQVHKNGGKAAFLEGNHPLVPNVLYHGTARDIRSFDPEAKRSYDIDPSKPDDTDTGWFGKGHYFTSNPRVASHYAKEGAKRSGDEGANIMPVHVSIKNPFLVNMKEYDSGATTLDKALTMAGVPMHPRGWRKPSEQTAALIAMGHDGVIATREGKPQEYVAFHPTQIKSAIGNRGTFDPHNPDITYAKGGRVGNLASFLEGNHPEVPPVVYHSTRNDFHEFHPMSHFGTLRAAHMRYNTHENWHPAHLKMDLSARDVNVIPAHLSLKNPIDLGKETGWQTNRDTLRQVADWMRNRQEPNYQEGADALQKVVDDRNWMYNQREMERQGAEIISHMGHDGIIYTNDVEDPGSRSFIALFPHQVKSAIGNNGDYNPLNPDMTKAEGGRVAKAGGGSLGLYSKAAQIIRGLKQETGNAQDMVRAALGKGAKRSEIANAYIPEGKMNRDDLARLFEASVPRMIVDKRGYASHKQLSPEELSEYENLLAQPQFRMSPEDERRLNELMDARNGVETRFDRFQLPDGDNYREHLIRHEGHPNSNSSFLYPAHWQKTPNVIVHARMNDRHKMYGSNELFAALLKAQELAPNASHEDQLENGVRAGVISPEEAATIAKRMDLYGSAFYGKPDLDKKFLHVEELQSDWNNEARRKGFRKDDPWGEYNDYVDKMRQEAINGIDPTASPMIRRSLEAKYNTMDPYMLAMKVGRQAEHSDMYKAAKDSESAPPQAPYIDPHSDAAIELGLKHLLTEAAKGGYHGISFTPDEAQSNRWGGTEFNGIYNKRIPGIAAKLIQQHDPSIRPQSVDVDKYTAPVIPMTETARQSILQKGFPAFKDGGEVTDLTHARAMRSDDGPSPGARNLFESVDQRMQASQRAYDEAKAADEFKDFPVGDVWVHKPSMYPDHMEVMEHSMKPVAMWGGKEPPKIVYSGHFPVVSFRNKKTGAIINGSYPTELLRHSGLYQKIAGKPQLVDKAMEITRK